VSCRAPVSSRLTVECGHAGTDGHLSDGESTREARLAQLRSDGCSSTASLREPGRGVTSSRGSRPPAFPADFYVDIETLDQLEERAARTGTESRAASDALRTGARAA